VLSLCKPAPLVVMRSRMESHTTGSLSLAHAVLRVLYQEEEEMRKLLTLCLLADTAVVLPAGAQAANVHSTLTGTITTADGWCCGGTSGESRASGPSPVSGVSRSGQTGSPAVMKTTAPSLPTPYVSRTKRSS
jgi:hypothetical protein